MEEKNFEIEPVTLAYDLLHNWWVILMGAAAAAMLACIIAGVTYVPKYTAETTYVVSAGPGANTWNNLTYSNDAAKAFENVIKSKVMTKIVGDKMNREEFDAAIKTQVPEETNLLVLQVTDKTPQDAIDLMHKLMETYAEVSVNAVGNATIDVLAEPQIPLEPDNPLSEVSAAVKGGLLGAVLMILLIGFLSCMKDSLNTEKDIEKKVDAQSLGSIPFQKKKRTLREIFTGKKKSILVNSPLVGFAYVEAYKKLAAKVDYEMTKKNAKVLVVTSVAENEGKSTMAANLAISLAEQSKKVLLIDGDLRRPSQFLVFEMNPGEKEEFGEFLKNGQTDDIMRKTDIPNLYMAFGKNAYASSTELLRSKRLADFLKQCRNYMDYVIIDSAPAGLIGDAEVIAGYSDEVLLVARQHDMVAESINDVLDGFREHHSDVLGVVLNGTRGFAGISGYGHDGSYGNYGRNRGK